MNFSRSTAVGATAALAVMTVGSSRAGDSHPINVMWANVNQLTVSCRSDEYMGAFRNSKGEVFRYVGTNGGSDNTEKQQIARKMCHEIIATVRKMPFDLALGDLVDWRHYTVTIADKPYEALSDSLSNVAEEPNEPASIPRFSAAPMLF